MPLPETLRQPARFKLRRLTSFEMTKRLASDMQEFCAKDREVSAVRGSKCRMPSSFRWPLQSSKPSS